MSLVSIIGKNLGQVEEELAYESIEELAAIISSNHWAPGIFEGRKRLIANLSRIDLLVLDVDDGCTLDQALETFKDFRHIIATSRNHQKEKNGVVCDRFRVVLFLDSSIDNDRDFKATWDTAKRRWPFIDGACKDSSRFFYASPNICGISQSGRSYSTSVDLRSSDSVNNIRGSSTIDNPSSNGSSGTVTKGELWKSTLDLLTFGAPAGTRHTRLVSAVGNMKEQGYSHPEALELLEEMTQKSSVDWTQPYLNEADQKTLQRMYNRETKYPFKPVEETKSVSSPMVNASDLLDETFSYLADKDKVKGEPTGIAGLDTLLGGGFRTGELTVLMAQAKTGKNTLYHYLMYKHLERGIPFGYASRELNPATEVIPNLLSIAMQTNAWTNNVDTTFQSRAKQILSKWILFFAPGYGYYPALDMETWFRALKDLGINHFLFDHFHYALEGEDYEATAKLIKRLKSITKELDIHLSLIVQPRSLREGEQLSLATLRGGAAIGQALDNLLILERVKNETNISKLTLEVARHKLARLGSLFLKYDADTTSFEEVDRRLVSEESSAPIPKGIYRDKFEKFIRT